jgi:hypothetical protein
LWIGSRVRLFIAVGAERSDLPCVVLAVLVEPGEPRDKRVADALKGQPPLRAAVDGEFDERGEGSERLLPVWRVRDRP